MNSFLFYLVMLIPNTERPTIVLLQVHDTAAECHVVLAKAPADVKDKFACIEINLTPQPINPRNKI